MKRILLAIKNMSLSVKIIIGVAVALVIGEAAVIVAVVNNQPPSNSEVASIQDGNINNTDEQEFTPEPQKNEQQQTESTPQVEQPQQQQQQSQQPSQPTPAPQPERPKTCSELQNCDYNLNDKYVIIARSYDFYALPLPEGVSDPCDAHPDGDFYAHVLPIAETKTFYSIGLFDSAGGGGAPGTILKTSSCYTQALNYASKKNFITYVCCACGDVPREWTWQEAVDRGFALDESKCAAHGLSCGRW